MSPMKLAAIVPALAALTACDAGAGDGRGAPSARQAQRTSGGSASATLPSVRLMNAFPGLEFLRPVDIQHAGDGSGRLFVVEQTGTIRVFDDDSSVREAAVFLDLRDRIYYGHNEEGLLSLAFHPKFAENRQFFVYYSANRPRRGVLSRFTVDSVSADRADASTEEVILEVEQPWGNHNGATVLFGPDAYLYVSLGDGGAANDPHGNGQNLGTLLGSILRIDVDRRETGSLYSIPKDNPFVDRDGARPEIWAYGLRNVWRMSFDRETGELWAGDVGQNRWEEIDLIVKGGNYGWNIREGFHPFMPEQAEPDDPAIDPVVEYGRDKGLSVTGGVVYRGEAIPRLRGAYLYADYGSGRIWGLRYEDGKLKAHREISHRPGTYITSFGQAPDGEVFVLTFDQADVRGSRGRVWRIGG